MIFSQKFDLLTMNNHNKTDINNQLCEYFVVEQPFSIKETQVEGN